jgi:hypothetical protein
MPANPKLVFQPKFFELDFEGVGENGKDFVTVFLLIFEKMRHVALKTSDKSGTHCQYFAIALEDLLRCLAVMCI